MKKLSLGLAVLTFLVSANSIANDTNATVKNGVVEYQISRNISMDSEVLEISVDKINITYNFTNHSDRDIITDVAFPLPPSPVYIGDTWRAFASWDVLYDAYLVIEQSQKKAPYFHTFDEQICISSALLDRRSEFLDFKVIADGKDQRPRLIMNAKKTDGTDITKLLRDNDIPLSATYVGGFMEQPYLDSDPKLKEKLLKLNLLKLLKEDKANGYKSYEVLWQLYEIFVWKQTFPSNKTITTQHSYKPQCGSYFISGKLGLKSLAEISFNHRDVEEKSFTDFCLSSEGKANLIKLFAKTPKDAVKDHSYMFDEVNNVITYRVAEIQYVLKTGSNWKGPIKKFKLIINPPKKALVVLSNFDGKFVKNKDGQHVCELENFTPQKDLKILFILPDF